MEKLISDNDIKIFKSDIEKCNIYNFERPSNNDYTIMDIVSATIGNTKFEEVKPKDVTFEETIRDSLIAMSLLDKKYIQRLTDIQMIMCDDLESQDCKTFIGFYGNAEKVYSTCEIRMSDKMTDLTKIWLSHEYIHALKDTSYNEFMGRFLTAEILPMFFEMILANNTFSDIHDKWKNKRLEFLNHSNKHYNYGKTSDEEDEINKYIIDSYGQYFIGYYYALNLYSLYKEKPRVVLKGIKKVLDHKLTTKKLLQKLDLVELNNKNINTFVYEHKNI